MKALKLTINLIFLTISISLSTYFMVHLTSNTYIRIGLGIFVLNLEIAMQYILALGKFKFKTEKVQAVLLFFCYFLYVIIYNIPSGVGFFLTERDVQDEVYFQNQAVEYQREIRLEEIRITMEGLNKQLDTESKTGFGGNSRQIMVRMGELKAERNQILKKMEQKPEIEEVVLQKNPFQSLSNVLGIRANILAAIVFGTSMLLLCVILIITSWDLPGEKLPEETPIPETIPLVEDDKDALLKYVDAAIRDTGKLNGNPRIMETTGIPLDQCIRFRDWLTNLKIDGVPAVTITQGGGDVNIPKHRLLKVIEGV